MLNHAELLKMGMIEGYISIRLESVISADIIHLVVNAGTQLPIYLEKGGYRYNMLLNPAITGFVDGLPFTVLAFILFIKAGNTVAMGRRKVQQQTVSKSVSKLSK